LTPTEPCWLRESADARTALVGFGNPLHGDDAIGPLVARRLYELLPGRENIDLLELCTSDFGLMERLVGYRRALIIDALVDEEAEVGALRRVDVAECADGPSVGLHTAGFGAALALARMLGLCVPVDIVIYGVVVRERFNFGDGLSEELEARFPEIVAAIAAAEGRQ